MDTRNRRIELLKKLLAQQELGSQEEILRALAKRGFKMTQASMSRDLKQMKAVKITGKDGRKVYALPNETAYKRISQSYSVQGVPLTSGFQSIHFSENIAVIKTKPGYAGSIAYNIDNGGIAEVLGTIAGNDTVFILLKAGTMPSEVIKALNRIIPDIR